MTRESYYYDYIITSIQIKMLQWALTHVNFNWFFSLAGIHRSYRKDFYIRVISEATRWARENYIRLTDDEIFSECLHTLVDGFIIIIRAYINFQSIYLSNIHLFLLTAIESFQHQMISISCDMHIWVIRPPNLWTLILFFSVLVFFCYFVSFVCLLNVFFIVLHEFLGANHVSVSVFTWNIKFLYEISLNCRINRVFNAWLLHFGNLTHWLRGKWTDFMLDFE